MREAFRRDLRPYEAHAAAHEKHQAVALCFPTALQVDEVIVEVLECLARDVARARDRREDAVHVALKKVATV